MQKNTAVPKQLWDLFSCLQEIVLFSQIRHSHSMYSSCKCNNDLSVLRGLLVSLEKPHSHSWVAENDWWFSTSRQQVPDKPVAYEPKTGSSISKKIQVESSSCLTPRGTVLLEKLTGPQLVKKFAAILWNPQGSLLHSQLPATHPYPVPDQSSLCPHPTSWRSISIYIHSNEIHNVAALIVYWCIGVSSTCFGP